MRRLKVSKTNFQEFSSSFRIASRALAVVMLKVFEAITKPALTEPAADLFRALPLAKVSAQCLVALLDEPAVPDHFYPAARMFAGLTSEVPVQCPAGRAASTMSSAADGKAPAGRAAGATSSAAALSATKIDITTAGSFTSLNIRPFAIGSAGTLDIGCVLCHGAARPIGFILMRRFNSNGLM